MSESICMLKAHVSTCMHVFVDGARTYVYTYGAPRAIPRACICAVVVEWARTSSLYLLIIDCAWRVRLRTVPSALSKHSFFPREAGPICSYTYVGRRRRQRRMAVAVECADRMPRAVRMYAGRRRRRVCPSRGLVILIKFI